MDEQRLGAYWELIQALLSCPSGEEMEILQANSDLVDAELVQVMEGEADKMAEEGNQEPANWLRGLAAQLAQMLDAAKQKVTPEEYHQFLMEVLQAVSDQRSPESIYLLLRLNLDKLDDNLQRILEDWTAQTIPTAEPMQAQFIANDLVNFSSMIANFPLGSISSNMEIAIVGYAAALKVYTQSASPQSQYYGAMTKSNLGISYFKRIKGDKAENIEAAISAYGKALQVYTQSAFPYEWADTQSNLGAAYHERINGDKAENIEQAIATYGKALQVCTQSAFPYEWAMIQHNLGMAYCERINGDKAENVEAAFSAYHQALQVYTQSAFPQKWARTQINLAAAYCNRIIGDKAENMEEAIAACCQALQVYTQSDFPQDWAQAQITLGAAYHNRIQGDKAENIEAALSAYGQALQVYTQSALPYEWAMTQHNLASAYCNRIIGDKAENIEQAIAACNLALQERTQSALPYEWAMTQGNLATAHFERIKGDKAENIEQAIAAYGQVLQVYTQSAFPQHWALAQNNLGNAYCDRIIGDKAENIESALSAYRQALQVYTQSAFPYEWARTKINLGSAYCYRIIGDKAENIESALSACNQALQVYTQSAFPQEWAGTQHNLGNAYDERIIGDKAENIEYAISAYRQALQIYTPQNFPIECFGTGCSLGNIGFSSGNYKLAIEGYELAIAAVEQSRNWATNDDRRQEILKEAIEVYVNIVQAYINIGQIDKALEYVERSRSKRLVDLMASNDLYSGGEITPEVREKLQAYELLQQQIDRERLSYQYDSDRQLQEVGRGYQVRAAMEPYNEKIAQLEAEKQQVWQQLRILDPVLAGGIEVSSPNLAAMQQLISSSATAILSFYSTYKDTYIFILRQSQNPQLHTCTGQGGKLQHWIRQNWLKLYIEEKTKWQNQMSDFLVELSQRLQLDELISQYLGDIEELILVPHLDLHQIPFAALPITNTGSPSNVEYLGDRFRLRTVPSCQVLEFCHNRPQLEADLNYGTVEDATEDLPLATFECEQIVQMYDIPEDRRLKGRQSATVENYRQLVKQVQVLHSSHHAQFRIDNPLESLLVLGDGFITLGELMTPGWRLPNLSDVFLSCCETNLGRMEFTDDLLTLSTGFLCAGARSVVNTLWTVDELATALLSIFYYQFRQQGDNRPTALWKAQVALRTLSGEEFAQRYQGEIERFFCSGNLKEVSKEVKEARDRAKKERDKHPPDSEAYQQWHEEYERLKKLNKKLRHVRNSLERACMESFPFESPHCWAAFTCQGLP